LPGMTAHQSELRLRFPAAPYLGLPMVLRVKAEFDIEIAERTYPPILSDLERDWVSSVAAPAFSLLARQRAPDLRRRFCTIGTGSGLDALAAAENFGADRIAITDLFDDVVAIAAANISANLAADVGVEIFAGAGDLLTGLQTEAGLFDVVYENLPNIPVADAAAIAVGRTSGAHLAPRAEVVPEFVRRQDLTLHWLALAAARPWLAVGGVVLSAIGSRVPLATIAEMSQTVGYAPRALTYG